MMNIQNPSFAQHQHAYGYGHTQPMSQPEAMTQFAADFNQSQNHFQQFPNTPQRPPQFNQQFQGQIPPQLYQQQQQQQQVGGFVRPQSRDNLGLAQGQPLRQSPANLHQRSQSVLLQGNVPHTPSSQRQTPGIMQQNMNVMSNMGANVNMNVNMNMLQQSPTHTQMSQAGVRNPPQQASAQLNTQSAAREEERVSTLLEINAHLIQEVTILQAQGKAGSQPSTSSPTTENMNTGANSPSDPSKKQAATQEYADCMRRLQANLAYLAAIADATKKATGSRPVGPAIMVPPTHLTSVHPLYQKLKALFPEANHTPVNKAIAVATAQAQAAKAAAAQSA